MAVYTTIDDPSAYFKVQLWTGNATNRSITFDDTDTDMQPDAIWIKDRDGVNWQDLTDSVRGATKSLYPSETNAEGTIADAVTAFGSDGFSLGTNAQVNGNTVKYVAWCWKESATAGFDIVSYTGNGSNRTISHSLSAEPHWMLFKSRSDAYSWVSYTKTYGNNSVLALNSTGANDSGVGSSYFNSTNPTSSVFSLGTAANMNGSSKTFIAYLFAPKQGFSKFGSYTGNGNADGTFVYTGFKPAFLIIKKSSAIEDWGLIDNKRDPNNDATSTQLFPNGNNAEDSSNLRADFLSNGFKLRTSSGQWNTSSGTYIYMCFAESPLVNSNGVPCNAR